MGDVDVFITLSRKLSIELGIRRLLNSFIIATGRSNSVSLVEELVGCLKWM